MCDSTYEPNTSRVLHRFCSFHWRKWKTEGWCFREKSEAAVNGREAEFSPYCICFRKKQTDTASFYKVSSSQRILAGKKVRKHANICGHTQSTLICKNHQRKRAAVSLALSCSSFLKMPSRFYLTFRTARSTHILHHVF